MLHASYLFWERSKNYQRRFRQYHLFNFSQHAMLSFSPFCYPIAQVYLRPMKIHEKRKRQTRRKNLLNFNFMCHGLVPYTCRTIWILILSPKMSYLISHTLDLGNRKLETEYTRVDKQTKPFFFTWALKLLEILNNSAVLI